MKLQVVITTNTNDILLALPQEMLEEAIATECNIPITRVRASINALIKLLQRKTTAL
jgi:hypothetical protein